MKAILIVCATFLLITSVFAQTPKRSEAVFRSVAVPGWGQFYNEQPVKGWLFLGAEAACISSWIYFDRKANSYYEDYQLTTDPNLASEVYDDVEQNRLFRDISIGAAGVVFLGSVLDAYLSFRDEPGSEQDVIGFHVGQNKIGFTFTFALGGI